MPLSIVLVTLCAVGLFWLYSKWKRAQWKLPKEPFPNHWRLILRKHVNFYNALNPKEQAKFEFQIQEFLLNCRITGIKTEVEDMDRMFVASSAIIPIFKFDQWKYTNIKEVLLYPNAFNHTYETEGPDRSILGMVGNGYMEGKMILSRQSLRLGFKNESDKKNVAIHEFIHLIDKKDGMVDGIPSILLEKQYTIPWMDLINKKIEEIYQESSDINPYGATNKAEFFAVTSEYFFERPKLLEKKHPELYALLEEIFDHDMAERNLNKVGGKIGRNSPCICNSGKKFKHCCGYKHYH